MSKEDSKAWANLMMAAIIGVIFYSFGHARGELAVYHEGCPVPLMTQEEIMELVEISDLTENDLNAP